MKDIYEKELSQVKEMGKGVILRRRIGEGSFVHPKERYDTPEEFIEWLKHLYAYKHAERFTSSKTVLDLGCGTGYGIHELSTKAMNTIGVDIWKEGIYYCHQKYGEKTSFLMASGLNLPVKDDCIDLIVSFQVIEHIDPEMIIEYLKEIKRVLKDSGIFMVSTPNRRLRLLPFQKPWNPDHKKEYDAKDLERALKRVFKNVEVLGLFTTKDVYLIEYNRVKQNPLFVYVLNPMASIVKHILPVSFIILLKRVMAKRRKVNERPRGCGTMNFKFSAEDFQTSRENLEACIDLYGICAKKTK